jgi:hypothetical protein
VPRPRHGLTIYEVFLALTLLLGALAVLSQHVAVGTRAAVRGQLQSRAALLCETKLSEVLAGIEPMSQTSEMSIEDAGAGWTWSLEVAAGPAEDLLNLAVTVAHANERGENDASFTVHRLARDPQVFTDAASAASSSTAAGSSSGSVTGSPSGSAKGSSATGGASGASSGGASSLNSSGSSSRTGGSSSSPSRTGASR